MSTTLEVIDSYLSLDSTQYAQAPIGATRLATKGNGTNLYGTIPTWTATNWEIEFDVVFPTTLLNLDKNIFDSGVDGANRVTFYIAYTSNFMRTIGANAVFYMDGVAITENTAVYPVDGAVHHIKMTGTTFKAVGTLLRRYTDIQYFTGSLFNLRLTDLDTPANSRFYPMDEAYFASSPVMFDSLTGLGANLVPAWATTFTPINTTTSLVNGKLTVVGLTGVSNRIEIPTSGLTIGKVYLLEVDCNKVGATANATIDGATWGEENWNGITWATRTTFRKLVTATATSGLTRIYTGQAGGVAGDTIEIYGVSISEANTAGTWFNRTAGAVVTVYPGAIKPSEGFWIACKFRLPVTTASKFIMNVGSYVAGGSSVVLRTDSASKLVASRYNATTAITNATSTITMVAGTEYIVLIKQGADNSIRLYVNAIADTWFTSSATVFATVLDWVNLNGAKSSSGAAAVKGDVDIYYAYLYNGTPSNDDINALMAGENPAYVGDIRQGYNLAGNGDEVNGGPALTLYNSPTFYVPPSHNRPLIGNLLGLLIGNLIN